MSNFVQQNQSAYSPTGLWGAGGSFNGYNYQNNFFPQSGGGSSMNPLMLVPAGLSFLGGLFDDSAEVSAESQAQDRASRERIATKELMQRQKEAEAANRFKGLDLLARNRAEAGDMARRYSFNNALSSALRGNQAQNPLPGIVGGQQ